MAIHVVNEAKRCLNCTKPLCMTGCPISTPIPKMIQTFLSGNITEAGEMVFENNPLSIVCSLVCDHEKQCEGHCILGKKGAPVHISSIENYISENYFEKISKKPVDKKGIKAAIIGSGPAGITIAVILAKKGYDITLFESRDKIGGVLRYGIPEFRLPKTILDKYKRLLLDLGIKIRPNTSIGGALTIDDLFRDGYKAIFIGTGVWRPNKLNIKGESLGNVHYAIDYLTNPDSYELGERLIIVGAGNAAIDVARTALRKGVRNVTIFARRGTAAAGKREVEYALIDGVEFVYFKAPVEITDRGVIFESTIVDENGHLQVVPDSQRLYEADSVIVSVSQGPKNKIASTTEGLDVNRKGLAVVDEEGHTSREGIFASGDVVTGPKTVVEAVAYSKEVADAMDAYMQATKA
ncbi:MAG TPA: dihydropyrimidine dehydrogenase [Peptococcaceae bacterium]|nr:dihydropyrimidine dehydrogenase [Peptococcaceae bacterium]